MMATIRMSEGRRDVEPAWAWAPYEPDAQRPWDLARAGHLLRRATWGTDGSTLQKVLQQGPQQAVDQLLDPPADVASFEQQMRTDEEAVASSSGMDSLAAWWLRRLIRSPFPLQEKMTLFWHSHFGVGRGRVSETRLLLRHIQTLRQHALGSYRQLLEAASQDAAVLLSVGAERNRKLQPNENFARQLMERYSVGPGHYGDEDVREAARAFTGWSVLRGRLRFLEHEHDAGTKQVLGRQGDFAAEDIVRIVLQQPTTPLLLARKLFRWLVSEVDDPPDPLLQPLADMLAQQYDVGKVVEKILRSNLFFSPEVYRRRVKSPVEYAVGIVAAVPGDIPTLPLVADCAALGQDLLDPPTTAGWVGGSHWLNTVSVLARTKLAAELLGAQGRYGGKLDVAAAAQQQGCATAREAAHWLLDVLLQQDVAASVRNELVESVSEQGVAAAADQLREVAVRMVTLPEFHLC